MPSLNDPPFIVLILCKRGDNVHILLISKTDFQSGGFKDCKSVVFDAATQIYTITKADNTTVTYSASLYYISILWS